MKSVQYSVLNLSMFNKPCDKVDQAPIEVAHELVA